MFSILLKIPLRVIQFLCFRLSHLSRRDKNLWVFGSFGHFNDNSRYLYEYVVSNHPEIRAVWISEKPKSIELASKFGEAYSRNSLKGFWFTLKAKVFIFSAYPSDICWYTSGGAIKVNLWHGVPLKKIEFDIQTPPLVDVFRNAGLISKFRNPHAHIKYDLVLSPSKYVAEYSFLSAFRLKDMSNIVVSTYPRVLKIAEIAEKKKPATSEFVFLYAPTWRDAGGDFIAASGIDFDRLETLLAQLNARLMVKLHPSTKISCDLSRFKRIELVNNQQDPCNLMAQSDCLITDYSSMYFDYLILDKPIIFFPFDRDEYLKGREFYFEYERYTPGIKATSFDEFFVALEDTCQRKDLYKKSRKQVRDVFMVKDTLSNENLVMAIRDKI